jgi:hypothetical protein
MGAKSRDAPIRAHPKYALTFFSVANGMDSYSNLIALGIIFYI